MTIPTLKVLASLLQLHGPGTTVQSDHPGINALLKDSPEPIINQNAASQSATLDEDTVSETPSSTQVFFRRAFGRGGPYVGGFRRGVYYPRAGFRRAFGRAW